MSERGLIYSSHFGLNTLPFENVPDPAFFFSHGDYTRVLEHLTACFTAGRGLMVVTGPIGSGKTTLSQKIMFSVPQDGKLVWMAEPPETSNDFLLLLAQELDCETPPSQGRSFMLRAIRDRLFALHKEGRPCLAIVDEVHKISDEVLETVRLLNNLEYGAYKLIQLILLGQEEFMTRLARPELSAFHQRIAALEAIGKMDPETVREYILHRLQVAGGRPEIFGEEALDAIANVTGGIPRVTNSLCDRALRAGYSRGRTVIDVEDVKEAVRELGDAGVDRKLFFYLLDRKHARPPGAGPTPEPGMRPVVPVPPTLAEGPFFDPPPAPTQRAYGPLPRMQAAAYGQAGAYGGRMPAGGHGRRRTPPSELALPLIGLAASIGLFLASLWFYCERSGSEGGHCLGNLLGFLS